jgi:RimJ/RimL family protein N-acetyltransferase
MKLQTLTREQVQEVREWRNNEPQFLRTPYLITEQMQDDFFDNVINNRDSKHRYFGIIGDTGDFILGMCGITDIEWENGTAEISLIIAPQCRGNGYGKEAVDLLLHEAKFNMRLSSIYGEVYDCGNRRFWEKIVKNKGGYKTDLVKRKYWNGELYGSMWFSI